MKETVLVTGGAGFIGSHLVEACLEKGYAVKVLDDLSFGSRANFAHLRRDIDFTEGSILDLALLNRVMKGVDFVLHQAALRSVFESFKRPAEYDAVNGTGTYNVLEASRANGVSRVVYAGSSSAYGDQLRMPLEESMEPQPLSPYAVSKLTGEHYCGLFHRVHGLETIVLRYFNVFGERQSLNSEYAAVIPKFIAAALVETSPTIFGDGKQSRDFTYVKNNVAANFAALNAPPRAAGQVYNVGAGESFTLLAVLQKINALLGSRVQPRFEAARKGDVRRTEASTEKAHRLLRFRAPHSFDDGLKRTVEWFKGGQA